MSLYNDRRRRPGLYHYVRILRGDVCSYCNTKRNLNVDHIVPKHWRMARKDIPKLTTGFGLDHWTNVTASCVECNQKRADKPLLLFLLEYPVHA